MTMADPSDSSLAFFTKGTPKQWEYVYELRKDVIRLKADQRSSKKGGPEEFIKLDNWFREKLPQSIHSRKDPHVVYEELVQIAKWRLMMGKYRPKMLDLVRINTETSVLNITRKAFRKLSLQKNLQQAITMLVNLKGIGPSTASAVLAAAYPEEAPFMSDEGMLSTPGVEATDSTIAEYNNYSEQIRNKTQSLRQLDPDYQWTPHKVDQALWIYYLARDFKPQLLEGMPRGDEESVPISSSTGGTPVDAEDDNANVVPANEVDDSNDDSNLACSNNNSHLLEATSLSSSGECLLNGNTGVLPTMFHEEDSASVPYSEEDLSQSGGASLSSVAADSSCGAQVVDEVVSTGGDVPLINSNGTVESTITPLDNSLTTTTNNSISNGLAATTNGNNSAATTNSSSGVGEEDSKDCMDSEDSRGGLLMMMTPSEENSVDRESLDGVVEHEHEVDNDQPPLKKQKTLELSSALAAATAADATEV